MSYKVFFGEGLGPYIKSQRIKLNLSQMEVSRQLGFSAQFYGLIEKGKVGCPKKKLALLVDVLQLDKEKVIRIILNALKSQLEKLLFSKKNSKINNWNFRRVNNREQSSYGAHTA